MADRELITVGWLERISLPDWGIDRLVAKIDTGAKTSAIHAENIEELEGDRVKFEVITSRSSKKKPIVVETDIARKTIVRSSSGKAQTRYVVKTTLCMAGVCRKIEITLSSRKRMSRRMLVGRTTLAGNFIVDASQTHLS